MAAPWENPANTSGAVDLPLAHDRVDHGRHERAVVGESQLAIFPGHAFQMCVNLGDNLSILDTKDSANIFSDDPTRSDF